MNALSPSSFILAKRRHRARLFSNAVISAALILVLVTFAIIPLWRII